MSLNELPNDYFSLLWAGVTEQTVKDLISAPLGCFKNVCQWILCPLIFMDHAALDLVGIEHYELT